jgi:hypothetical protein
MQHDSRSSPDEYCKDVGHALALVNVHFALKNHSRTISRSMVCARLNRKKHIMTEKRITVGELDGRAHSW